MEWLNEPASWQRNGDVLRVSVDPGTDFWRATGYGYVHDNGHIYGDRLRGDLDVSVRVRGAFASQYDQAGIMLRADEETWLKTGLEFFEGRPRLSTVLTMGWSSWMVSDLPPGIDEVTLRVSRRAEAVEVRYTAGDGAAELAALVFMPPGREMLAGIACAAPEGSGFSVTFNDLRVVGREWGGREVPNGAGWAGESAVRAEVWAPERAVAAAWEDERASDRAVGWAGDEGREAEPGWASDLRGDPATGWAGDMPGGEADDGAGDGPGERVPAWDADGPGEAASAWDAAGETPGGKTPGEKSSGEKSSGKKTPAGKTPGGKTPGEKTPGGKTPAGKTSGGKPAGRKSAAGVPDGWDDELPGDESLDWAKPQASDSAADWDRLSLSLSTTSWNAFAAARPAQEQPGEPDQEQPGEPDQEQPDKPGDAGQDRLDSAGERPEPPAGSGAESAPAPDGPAEAAGPDETTRGRNGRGKNKAKAPVLPDLPAPADPADEWISLLTADSAEELSGPGPAEESSGAGPAEESSGPGPPEESSGVGPAEESSGPAAGEPDPE